MALRGLPVDVLSADQVAVPFGRGSMLHSAFVALKANNRFFKCRKQMKLTDAGSTSIDRQFVAAGRGMPLPAAARVWRGHAAA
ncbi:MAG: hypothetical protein WCZ23_12270, partial [Rhodospirillaceae bacterium]